MTDNVVYYWFGDICIRVSDIQAFTDSPTGTNVFLTGGQVVVSSLPPLAFEIELGKARVR
jgi:hypothetical protein